jgi:O-antigen ligase
VVAASLWTVVVLLPVLAAAGALDVSLNGRTRVWDYSLSRVDEHPLLGLGPGGWSDFVASGRLTALATSGHNQFVESLTTLGLAGVVCLTVLALRWLRALVPGLGTEASVAVSAFGLIWAFAILESPISLWGVSPQSWLVMMLTIACLGAELNSGERRRGSTRGLSGEVR